MSSSLSKLDRICHRLFRRSYGWTGVEIGCHEINLAQLRLIDKKLQLAAVWTVNNSKIMSVDSVQSKVSSAESCGGMSAEQISELGKLTSLFNGQNCAATVTDGLIDYRELELPIGNSTECQSMVHSEIALEMECESDQLVSACWELPKGRSRSTTTNLGAVSMPYAMAMQVGNDLLQAGFVCQVLDAVPCAIARAAAMTSDDATAVTLAIDLGFQQSTLCIVQNGKPLLSRNLRHQDLWSLIKQIAVSFEISLPDACVLLFQSPGSAKDLQAGEDSFSNPLAQQINSLSHSLCDEINRTIHFVERTLPTIAPTQAVLMGAGTRIPDIAKSIQYRIGMPTQLWSIPLADNLVGEKHLSSYAVAAGLSALAWEVL
jgi:type IV pilus assembly protein PilM